MTYPVDGIWLTMNDLYSDCNGYCSPYDIVGTQIPEADLEHQIGYIPGDERLDTHSLDLNAKYSEGTEFVIHNKFPLSQAEATAAYYAGKQQRGFVMSSSSISGQGRHGSSYSGDNHSKLADMEQSIHDSYLANIYGMPFHGSDVCGYFDDATVDLCTRWYLLAASQPFSRNANFKGQTTQSPYTADYQVPSGAEGSLTYEQVIKVAMRMKYNFLRYTISFFHGIHTTGGAYFKPMFFKYPNNANAYQDITKNIMLGDSLKFSFDPTTLDFETTTTSQFYFPEGKWCQVFPIVAGKNPCFEVTDPNHYETMPLSIDAAYLHMKEGSIVPF